MNRLQEANGSLDKLYSLVEKAKSSVEKAQNAVLDVADIAMEIKIEATAMGGSLGSTIPSHMESLMAQLDQIATDTLGKIQEGGQTSFAKIKELIENTPYRDVKPQSAADMRAGNKPVNLTPNLSAGPQSSMLKESEEIDLEDFYRNHRPLKEQEYKGFSFDQLRESELFGTNLDPDMMAFATRSENQSLGKYVKEGTKRIRETIENEANRDLDGEQLNENFDPMTFKSPGIDAGMNFNAIFNGNLSDGGHIV